MSLRPSNAWMDNALYTNGFLLGTRPELTTQLLAPETGMVFVRVSVNTVTDGPTRKHWGVSDPQEVYQQLVGVEALLKTREKLVSIYEQIGRPIPSIQISTIVDDKNIEDLSGVVARVSEIFGRNRGVRGAEDVMVVRPLVDHRRAVYSTCDHEEALIREIIDTCGEYSAGKIMMNDVGVPLYLGFGLDDVESGVYETYADVIRHQYRKRSACPSHGMFIFVSPNGDVQPFTELGCQPKWKIGNLVTQTVDEIYRSEERLAFVRHAESHRFGPEVISPFPRCSRLDRVAEDLMSGELTDDDVAEIREQSRGSHRLLLN